MRTRFCKEKKVGLQLLAIAGICLSCLVSKAQNYIPGMATGINMVQWTPFPDYDQIRQARDSRQKWFTSTYAGVSVGTLFYPTGTAYTVSAPIGIQLNRQLNKNLYAFGGVYLAPTVTSFYHNFMDPSMNRSYPGNYNSIYGGVNPGIQMGLMYVNDAGTFSISGSIRTERGYYPVNAPVSSPNNIRRK